MAPPQTKGGNCVTQDPLIALSVMPAFIFHDLAQGRAAAEAAIGRSLAVLMVSAYGASATWGPLGFLALSRLLSTAYPTLCATFVLDCADGPGHVLSALRAGVKAVRYHGGEGDRLAEIAAAYGVPLLTRSLYCLDLGGLRHPREAAFDWLGSFDPACAAIDTEVL